MAIRALPEKFGLDALVILGEASSASFLGGLLHVGDGEFLNARAFRAPGAFHDCGGFCLPRVAFAALPFDVGSSVDVVLGYAVAPALPGYCTELLESLGFQALLFDSRLLVGAGWGTGITPGC